MAQMKSYISNKTDNELRKAAMRRFGYGRGSISRAVEEAITQWLKKEATVEAAIEKLIEYAKKDKNVVAILLFGSYARKEPNFNDVDIGFLVDNANTFDILRYINTLEDESTDVVQITVINGFPEWIQEHIIDEGIILHVNDRDKLYDYTTRLIRDSSDNMHIAAELRS